MADNNENHAQLNEESTTTKYMIHVNFLIEGVVEKPDVVGALFGQTEGLLSDDLDLRELQKSGRVGRIQVNLTVRGGRTKGNLFIPSSLDKVETSILAAAIETVDRIGPCNAKLDILKIEDVREEKRKKIIERASDLLKKWDSVASQDSTEIHDEVIKAARVGGITTFGNLPAGPELNDSDTIIVVEGRADIAACLRAGVRNTIAVEGANVPKAVSDLSRNRTTIAFLDGDRGGDLILKELLMYGYIDFIARAPSGKEVEDLKPKEIVEMLSKKIPIEQANFISEIHANDILEKAIRKKQTKLAALGKPKYEVAKDLEQPKVEPKKQEQVKPQKPGPQQRDSRPPQQSRDRRQKPSNFRSGPRDNRDRRDGQDRYQRSSPQRTEYVPQIPEELMKFVKEVDGKDAQEGLFLDENKKEIKRVQTEKIFDELKSSKDKIATIVFDGVITQRLIEVCDEKQIPIIIGARIAELENKPFKVKAYAFS
ncbi:MAG: DNA primase DnaG [Candidatus Thorarchaeota archaeon]